MKTSAGLLAISLLLAACTSGPGATSSPGTTPGSSPGATPGTTPGTTPAPTPSPSPSGSPGDGEATLVFRIRSTGGLAGPTLDARTYPWVSVYSDGRVITEGPQIEIYPGPALPNLQVARLTAEGLQRLVDAAAAAGLAGRDRDYQLQGIMDATTTVFTLTVDGVTHTVSAYALGMEDMAGDRLSDEELLARRALVQLQALATDLRSWLGPDVTADAVPYEFEALRIFVMPASIDPVDEPLAEIREWPLDGKLGELGEPYPMGEDARCGVIDGDDLAELLPQVRESNELTQWESGDQTYQLFLRPLLPDEEGCPKP